MLYMISTVQQSVMLGRWRMMIHQIESTYRANAPNSISMAIKELPVPETALK